MYWIRILMVLIIASLLIFLIATKSKNKGIKIFFITYIFATLIRAFTGLSFNPFYNKFKLIPFVKDIAVWALSYVGSSLVVSWFDKTNNS